MKKILIFSINSSLMLTTFLSQASAFLKSEMIIKSDWIEDEKVANEFFNTPKKFKSIKKLYSNKKININLFKSITNETIARIYAKKTQKKYYLKLQNDHLYCEEWIASFVKKKFFAEKTQEYFISADKFYSFLDTKDFNGEIFKNQTIQFRSSWGVHNNQTVNSSIKFNFNEETIKQFILLHERNKLPQNIRLKQIEVQTIQPKKIGLLPIVQIHQPPIKNATFKTWRIKLNDWDNYKKYPHVKQNLIMPEGHNSGAEWWRGLVSAIGPIVAMVSGGLGSIITGAILKSLLTGALLGGVSQIVTKLIENIEQISIKEGIASIKKIYEKLMKNWFLISPHKTDFNNLKENYLSIILDGELWAEANATSIWGAESKMNLYAVWSAINSDVSYRIYK